jgi:hypothetical protein
VYGTLAATDTQLTLTDDGGRGFLPLPGRYEWKRRDNELWITLVSDPGHTWRAPIAKGPWLKVN